jgi:hypothetical protein
MDDEIEVFAGKSAKDLNDEERVKLIAEARSGAENPYYKVTFNRNGYVNISKRRPKAPTAARKNIETKGLNNEQLFMEHLIDLESRVTELKCKQKKLKGKYKHLTENFVYEDEAPIPQQQPPPKQEELTPEQIEILKQFYLEHRQKEQAPQQQEQIPLPQQEQPPRPQTPMPGNWRRNVYIR